MNFKFKAIWLDMLIIIALMFYIYLRHVDVTTPVTMVTGGVMFGVLGLFIGIWVGAYDNEIGVIMKKAKHAKELGYNFRSRGLGKYAAYSYTKRYLLACICPVLLALVCQAVQNFIDGREADWGCFGIDVAASLGVFLFIKLIYWLATRKG